MSSIWGGKSYPGLGIPGWSEKSNINKSEYELNKDNKTIDSSENTNNAKVISGFDPSALERGAKALKEIDNSENSKDVLKIALETEKTKQRQAALRTAELESNNLVKKKQLLQNEYEQNRRMEHDRIEQQKNMKKHDAQLKAEYTKQKLQQQQRTNKEWLDQQKQLFEQQRALEKKTAREIESEKRRTIDYQHKKDIKRDTLRIKQETEGRIQEARENVDITERLSMVKLKEDRETRIKIRKEELDYYASFFLNLRDTLTSSERLPYLVGGISAMAFGIYGSKTLLEIFGKYVDSKIGKPLLVRETSRKGWRDYTPHRLWKKWAFPVYNIKNIMEGIILDPAIENRINFVVRGTKLIRENKGIFRHSLIYGPPGTGKTLFARSLAKNSGMHFAIISGGDFAPLGASAITELHRLFDWAENSGRGMILFIDEADAFLRKGRGEHNSMSENMRNALSAFLQRTGTESTKFMIVLATNIPEMLDQAVKDRIDEAINFSLPGLEERKRILQLYFRKWIKKEILEGKIVKNIKNTFDENDKVFDRLANATDGFSGRQLSKYMISVQTSLYAGGVNLELSQPLLEQILDTYVQSKNMGISL